MFKQKIILYKRNFKQNKTSLRQKIPQKIQVGEEVKELVTDLSSETTISMSELKLHPSKQLSKAENQTSQLVITTASESVRESENISEVPKSRLAPHEHKQVQNTVRIEVNLQVNVKIINWCWGPCLSVSHVGIVRSGYTNIFQCRSATC